MHRLVLSLALLTACAPAEEEPPPEDAVPAALPTIEGVAAAEDTNPDPDVVEVTLVADEAEASWLEGTEPTPVFAYNGQVPGPLIQARVGNRVIVHLQNDLDEPTTIHWHGLRIDDRMDGVPAIQAPVEPGESFTYDFVVQDPGSYWYHPHVNTAEQVEQGLQGVLVVHENEPPAVDTERWFVVDDARLDADGSFSPFTLGGMDAMHGRSGNTLLVNGATEDLTATLRPGSVERWRVVNTSNARTFWISVQGADWRVVATDGGVLEQPFEAARAMLPIGARVDLEVRPQAGQDAVFQVELPDGNGGFSEYPRFFGTVEGEDAGSPDPVWTPAPLFDTGVAPEQEVEFEFEAFNTALGFSWRINGDTWQNHEAVHVASNTPSTILLRNVNGPEHPFHLHGQFFQILERDGQPVDEPGLRDTVLVPGVSDVLISTRFDNPGEWMAHCYILEHAELGMMTEMIVE